jgi:hypothetical protein
MKRATRGRMQKKAPRIGGCCAGRSRRASRGSHAAMSLGNAIIYSAAQQKGDPKAAPSPSTDSTSLRRASDLKERPEELRRAFAVELRRHQRCGLQGNVPDAMASKAARTRRTDAASAVVRAFMCAPPLGRRSANGSASACIRRSFRECWARHIRPATRWPPVRRPVSSGAFRGVRP